MSAEASGYVWSCSPYEGATFTVHLALGDIANDAHDYELWILTKNLASKARVNPGTARKALLRLIEDGFLEIVEDRSDRNQASRYRFLMPPEGRATDATGRARDATPVAPQARQVAPETRHNKREPNERKPNDGNPSRDLDALFEVDGPAPTKPDPLDGFDEFWSVYPRRVAKGAARKAWPKAVTAAGGVEPILAGARRYAAERDGEDPKFTAHPATWLNRESWADEPTRPTRRPSSHRGVDQDRDRPEEVLRL